MLLSSPQHLQNTIKPRKVNEMFTWLWTNSQHPQGLRTETIWIGIQTCIIHSELKTTHPYQLCPFLLLPLLFTFFFFFWQLEKTISFLETPGQKTGCSVQRVWVLSDIWCLILVSGQWVSPISVPSIEREIFCLCRTRPFLPQVLTSSEHQSVLIKFGPTSIIGGGEQKIISALQLVEITTPG